MISIRSALMLLTAAGGAVAHMELTWPPALHSKYNPITPEADIDYSMTSPLVTDGTFPCKGFINNPSSLMVPGVTWDAGSTVNCTIAGTAVHGGGSCQYALSYDDGTTWSTIHSQIGGCVIDSLTADITIPTDAPSGQAIFAWMWENEVGNREMYMNCAVVEIANGGSGLNADDYPAPFVANAGVNDCVTIEGIDVVYPNPGKSVSYGGAYASTKPTTPAGFTGSNCVPPGQTNGNTTVASSSSSDAVSSTASSAAVVPVTASSSSSASTAATTGSTCKRRKRSINDSQVKHESRALYHDAMNGVQRRSPHERFVRRPRGSTGRVAAGKAEHISR